MYPSDDKFSVDLVVQSLDGFMGEKCLDSRQLGGQYGAEEQEDGKDQYPGCYFDGFSDNLSLLL